MILYTAGTLLYCAQNNSYVLSAEAELLRTHFILFPKTQFIIAHALKAGGLG